MSETTSWILSGAVAGVALMSLAAVGGDAREAPGAPASVRVAALGAAVRPGPGVPADVLADAYFDRARAPEAPHAAFDDWLVRHAITLKGLAAERGDNPAPESVADHPIPKADQGPLKAAEARLRDLRAEMDTAADPVSGEVLALLAATQARFDYWLFAVEANAPPALRAAARAAFEDTRDALENAAHRHTLAQL